MTQTDSPTLAMPTSLQADLSNIRIILARPSHPGNIGAAARAMKTMGITDMALVAPKQFPDAHADAMAAAAVDVLQNARVVDTLAEALEGCIHATAVTARRRELASEPLWAHEATQELASLSSQGKVALVFGNETFGLSNEEVALCQRWTMIPTGELSSSLNLSQAVQILCYEMRQAAVAPKALPPIPDAGELAKLDEIEGFLVHMHRAAVKVDFLDPENPGRMMIRLRRLFGRSRMEIEEIHILRGLLAAFEKALRK